MLCPEGTRPGTGEERGEGETGRKLGEGGARMPCMLSPRFARGLIALNASVENTPKRDLNNDRRG